MSTGTRAGEAVRSSAERADMDANRQRRHVLFVGEEPSMHRVLEQALRSDGLRWTWAADGAQALRVLEGEPIALLVTSLALPVLDGVDLLRHVANRGLKIPVVVATAHHPPAPTPGSALRFVRETIRPDALAAQIRERLAEPPSAAFALAELAQVLVLERRNCSVRALVDGLQGELVFSAGTLVHAAVGPLRGDPAARELLAWPPALLRVDPLLRAREVTVSAELSALLPTDERRAVTVTMSRPAPETGGAGASASNMSTAAVRGAGASASNMSTAAVRGGGAGASASNMSTAAVRGGGAGASSSNMSTAAVRGGATRTGAGVSSPEPSMARVRETTGPSASASASGMSTAAVRRESTGSDAGASTAGVRPPSTGPGAGASTTAVRPSSTGPGAGASTAGVRPSSTGPAAGVSSAGVPTATDRSSEGVPTAATPVAARDEPAPGSAGATSASASTSADRLDSGLAVWELPAAQAPIAALLAAALEIEGALGAGLAVWELDHPLGMRTGADFPAQRMEVALSGNCRVMRAMMTTLGRLGYKTGVHDVLITLEEQCHVLTPLARHDGLFLYLVLDRARGNLALARMRVQKLLGALRLAPEP